ERALVLRYRRRDDRGRGRGTGVTSRGAPSAMRGRPPEGMDAIEDLLATVLFTIVGALAGVGLAVLAGAQLAAVTFGAGSFGAGLSDSIDATIALASRPGAPADAWPESVQDHLPGPVAYWMCTIGVFAALGALAWAGFRWWTQRRHRGPFGVSEGGLAKPADTRTL